MFVLHLALGGCLKAPPIRYGITADTGGHIAYVLHAAIAQASRDDVDMVSVATRLFDDDHLGSTHRLGVEALNDKVHVLRIDSGDRRYLEKEALAADLPFFTERFCDHLAGLARRPDVIHAHFADAAEVALQARARFGIPVVYTPHALGIDKRAQESASGLAAPVSDFRIEAERRAIAECDAVIVSTHDEADRQVRAYGVAGAKKRLSCLPPGVPPLPAPNGRSTIADRLGEWFADTDRPLVLAIARPVRKKNLSALPRAFLAVPALLARANLLVLAGQHGAGRASAEERAELAELQRLAADPRLLGRVALPPAHDAVDVSALYRRAAQGGVFVNPALHEPFGLTLIEAASAGVPVVATRNGGPVEIVRRLGHGVLVDPRDDQAIGEACLSLLDDEARHDRLSRAGREGLGSYSWHRYARRSVDIYRSLSRAATCRPRAADRPALLACDIDNTLTGCPDGARLFRDWHRERKMPFVVATGRGFAAAADILARWRLPAPDAFITDVGTRIMLPDGRGGWRECALFEAFLRAGWDEAAAAAALARLRLSPQPPETRTPFKLSFFGDASDAARARLALGGAAVAARVVFSHDELIDVLPPNGGKARALAFHAARLGLSLRDCVAAGDSGNDLDMLDAAGHAIVVANASRELDVLRPRPELHRAAAPHAAGVVEGLRALGLGSRRLAAA
ncbi:HAD family hydrolase [Rhizosaccharibacter radicis]|uniref:sucrose-phosphate synthase n=1 Tax=Rhizosaccharibacter radicis TaxID=2782605 RepID=A0ABT1VWK7_9PROT|nr:glycosyltransferase [Acetobacteraceae bacterium KSS12]